MFSKLTRAQRVQFSLILLVAMLYFGAASMMLYLSKFVVDLGGNEQEAGALLGVGLVAMMALAPFVGGLSDTFGSKPLVVFGLIVYGAATFAHIYADRLGAGLVLLRFFQGVGHACVFSPLFAAVVRIVPSQFRARGIGYFTVCIQLGNTLGSLFGEYCVTYWSYVSLFTVSALICCAGAVAGFYIREGNGLEETGNRSDISIDESPEESSSERVNGQTTKKPFQFFAYLLILVLLGSTFGIALQFMPIFFDFMLKASWIVTPISNVYFMTTTLVTVAVVRLTLGGLSDGVHRDRVMNICHVILFCALFGFASIRSEMAAFISAILFGLAYGLLFPAVNAKLMGMANARERGKMSGWLAMFYEFGFRGLPILLGSVVYYVSYTAMFYLLAVSYAIGVAILSYCKLTDKKSVAISN